MEKKLSNDLIILSKIYEYEKVRKEPLWFSKLVELLDGKLDLTDVDSTRTAVSKSEDKMYDLGMIDKKYRMVGIRWTCCYLINDDVEEFARTIYEQEK